MTTTIQPIDLKMERVRKILEAYVSGFEDAMSFMSFGSKDLRMHLYINNPVLSVQYKIGWSTAVSRTDWR